MVVAARDRGRELIADGAVGNELAVYEEYPAHPEAGEGPWHLLPSGPVRCSSAFPASVRAYRSPLGERLVIEGAIGDALRYTQTLTLWRGIDRLDCRTTIDDFTGADRLVRLRWACPVPGAMPVSEVGDAVIGRGFGLMHDHASGEDRAVVPRSTLDPGQPGARLVRAVILRAHRGRFRDPGGVGRRGDRPFGGRGGVCQDLMVALVRAG